MIITQLFFKFVKKKFLWGCVYHCRLISGFQNVSFNGSLLPHLPGSNHGSPDIRMAASNLSLNNAGKKSDPHPHFPTIWRHSEDAVSNNNNNNNNHRKYSYNNNNNNNNNNSYSLRPSLLPYLNLWLNLWPSNIRLSNIRPSTFESSTFESSTFESSTFESSIFEQNTQVGIKCQKLGFNLCLS